MAPCEDFMEEKEVKGRKRRETEWMEKLPTRIEVKPENVEGRVWN